MSVSAVGNNAVLLQSLQLTQNMALQSLRQVAQAEQALASILTGAAAPGATPSPSPPSSGVGSVLDIRA
jgi:hypothetical protein